jgi:hypothetical protein
MTRSGRHGTPTVPGLPLVLQMPAQAPAPCSFGRRRGVPVAAPRVPLDSRGAAVRSFSSTGNATVDDYCFFSAPRRR